MKIIDLSAGHDIRPQVDFEEPFYWKDAAPCTYCGSLDADNIVVKQLWGGRPKGQLITRCPWHWRNRGDGL